MTERSSYDLLFQPPPPAALRIPYGSEPLQFGDLRVPEGEGSWPLAVVIHGGAWKANFNLIHTGHLCIALQERGIATWNIEFRRVGDPGGGWPGTLEDVLLAISYVDRLPLERSGLVLVGHSSGGHLALLAGARVATPIVAIAAATDFDAWESPGAAAFLQDTDRSAASPRKQLPLKVRQILVHGTDDDQVPFWVSERYVEEAVAKGDQAELLALEGDGHFEPIDPLAPSWPRVEDAIQRVMQNGGGASTDARDRL